MLKTPLCDLFGIEVPISSSLQWVLAHERNLQPLYRTKAV